MRELADTQSEPDHRNIPIDRVGVRHVQYPIQVKDKARQFQNTVATVSLAVDLPHQYRGTHMSRFIEVLQAHGPVLSVMDASRIPQELIKKLKAERAHVEFRFPFFLQKKAPVSGAASLMNYGVRLELTAEKDQPLDMVVEVDVPVTTVCPCSKAISARGAHNQRGLVRYTVRFAGEAVWIEDLIRLVESCASAELYALLKRPDEKSVTEQAYDHPVFVEDLVRNVAAKSEQQPVIAWYRIEAENFESIHNHNAYAIIEKRK